jgi:hypothetical protein
LLSFGRRAKCLFFSTARSADLLLPFAPTEIRWLEESDEGAAGADVL